jgi:hypothetical protein
MCDPTLIASIGAQVVGAQMQGNALKGANAEKALLMRQNAEQNRQLEDTQRAAIQEAVVAADSTAGKPGMEAAAVDLSNILKAAITGGGAQTNTRTSSAPQIVRDAEAAAAQTAMMKANQRASAIASLDATSKYLGTTIAPKIADAAAIGGMTGNFMSGNSAVTDTGLQYAASKAYSPMAQILSGAGQTGMAYGLYDPKKGVPVDKPVNKIVSTA